MALTRDALSLRSAETISAPCAISFLDASLEISRVTPRTAHSSLSLGSLRKVWTTEPPWLPVAPKTVMMFLLAMVETLLGTSFDLLSMAVGVGRRDASILEQTLCRRGAGCCVAVSKRPAYGKYRIVGRGCWCDVDVCCDASLFLPQPAGIITYFIRATMRLDRVIISMRDIQKLLLSNACGLPCQPHGLR